MTRKYALSLLLLLVVLLAVAALWLQLAIERTEQEIEHLQTVIQAQEQRKEQLELTRDLLQEVITLRQENEELHRRMQDWLEAWHVVDAEVTAYAPLDPGAVPGMCYSGNPNITASGAQVVPGVTVAAGPSVPFGTRVWVEGHGMRIVHDRGGRITDRHIDIAVWNKAEAMAQGRQTRLAVMPR